MLPIFIVPTENYKNFGSNKVLDANGDPVNLEEYDIVLDVKGGKAVVVIDGKYRRPVSQQYYLETQSKPGYGLKIDFKPDSEDLYAACRKLPIVAEEHIAVGFSMEDAINEIETTKLVNVQFDPRLFVPIKTGKYIDRFWSRKGGILPGTNTMITGDPGIGKSSNLMDILIDVHKTDPNKRVLYISAEMTKVDMEEFLQFYPGLEYIDFLFLGEYITDPDSKFKPYQALQATLEKGWDVVVIDSLYETQSMIQEDLDISSFKKGERWMLDLMNKHNSGFNKLNLYTAFLAIQQKNKSGQYVGSKRLEHMTTAFLQLLWDPKEKGKRYMIFEKNRKGKEKVKLYYSLQPDKGVVYDETRHQKELEFMELLQQNNALGLDSLDDVDFDQIFNGKIPDAAHAN